MDQIWICWIWHESTEVFVTSLVSVLKKYQKFIVNNVNWSSWEVTKVQVETIGPHTSDKVRLQGEVQLR